MANPDRDRVDQESSIGQSSESAQSAGDRPQSGSDRMRARVKPPGQPRSAHPRFLSRGVRPLPKWWTVVRSCSKGVRRKSPSPPRRTRPRRARQSLGDEGASIPKGDPAHPGRSLRQAADPGQAPRRPLHPGGPRTRRRFQPAGPGLLVASRRGDRSRPGRSGAAITKVKRVLIGAPLSTAAAAHERLTKVKALAVLSSDALSSVAYATEEILRVLLVAGGVAALSVSLPIGAAIVVLLVDRRHLVPADDQGLSARRRQLHRRQGQPGRNAGADRRRRAADRLRPDRGGVASRPRCAALISAFPELHTHGSRSASRFIAAGHDAQSARHPRVGQHFRRADLPLPDRHVRHDRGRVRRARRSTASQSRPSGGSGRARRRAGALTHLPHPAGVQLRLFGDDRCRGDLGRRAGLQEAGMDQRPHDADVDGRRSWR